MTVPEGYDSSSIIDYYPVPNDKQFDDGDFIYEPPLPPAAVVDDKQRVKLQKLDEQTWIYAKLQPSQVWPRLKQYLQQQGFLINTENGSQGIVSATSAKNNQEVYRFKLSQGFQRRSSELHVRALNGQSLTPWPNASDDASKEEAMLKDFAAFLADTSQSPAYSFAAQGISTEQKLFTQQDAEGVNQIKLAASRKRALASLKMALELAEFHIDNADAASAVITAKYYPQVDEEDQPGFFMRIIGFSRKEYDEDVVYAGNAYQFRLSSIDNSTQLITVDRADFDWPSPRRKRNELNTMMRLVAGTIH
jgi:uncharacterized lipoprotein